MNAQWNFIKNMMLIIIRNTEENLYRSIKAGAGRICVWPVKIF